MTHTASTANNTAIAIIGMGCVFPKSSHLKEFWHLIFNGIDAIGPIPEETHWKLKDYFDQDPGRPDHTYCKRGGFLPTVQFDPLSYGIPPNNLEATDTSQLLGLEVAKNALEDAGYPIDHSFLKNHKVNVVLGVTGTQELVIPLGARLGHPIWKKALKDSGIRKEKQEEVLDRIQGDYVQWQENSFPGLLGNVIAGRIANRFNLSGTNTASDAACASSLSALHTAVMELSTGKCDMSITGGADTLNDIFMHMCFSKTGVLSHTSDARPFSKDADGTVLGEGIGMVVLKRLEDAKKDKDRIYAVIKSIGTSSDGRTSAIYAPDADGQLKALNEAYKDAGIDPATVQLVEAHGTGTRVGDKVEFDALKKCFHPASSKSKNVLKNRTAIGTVKSMIGHTKAAAGAAGIIKTALALHNKVLPPTLKAAKPDPDLDIENSSFYLNEQSRPWVTGTQTHPRRSGVSAFGFGGSNFHAVLEEYNTTKDHVSWDGSVQIFAFSDTDQQGLIQQIKKKQSNLSQVNEDSLVNQRLAFEAGESRKRFKPRDLFRLAFVHKKDDDVLHTFEKAVHCAENKTGKKNIYFSCKKKKGKLGFLFPGQGSQYVNMAKELLSVFPEALDAIESADQIFGDQKNGDQKNLHDYIFAPPVHIQPQKLSEEQLRNTDIAQPAIGAVSLGLTRILNRFGVRPDVSCGHSFGELSALFSAGWIDDAAFLELAVARGLYMAQAGEKDGDAGSMLAVQAKLSVIEKLIEQEKLDLVLANRNSPLQGVLSGETSEIKKARKVCRQKKIRAIPLPVAAAFHSKLVKDAAVPFAKIVSTIKINPSKTDVLSNTTGKPYDRDVAVVKDLLGNQLANPVCFVDNIRHMANEQVTTFVEVGPKSVLTGLVQSILKEEKITPLSLDGSSGRRTGVENLAHVLTQIAAQGFDIDLTQWEDAVQKPGEKKMAVALTGANLKPKNRSSRPKSKIEAPPSATIPAETLKSRENKNRSKEKGSGMTQNRKKDQPTIDYTSYEAMKMVQQGLEAMQQLQAQTARAHEKFLDTQAQATRALAGMMDQTRKIAVPHDFSHNATPTYQPPAPPIYTPEPETVKDQVPVKPTPPVVEVEPSVGQSDVPVQAREPELKETPTPEASPQTQLVLFEIVSQLTGFPVEMLEPAMEIESDLGIDSIKKVEIISELEKKIPTCQGLTPENIGSVRTLEDICLIIDKDGQSAPLKEPVKDETVSLVVPNEPAEQTGKADSHIAAVLVETISELTGFPVEMLEPSMNLESDLGIDSIKRVEILSKLEQQLDHIDSISPDDIGALKTIAEITDYLHPGDKKTGSKKNGRHSRLKKKLPLSRPRY